MTLPAPGTSLYTSQKKAKTPLVVQLPDHEVWAFLMLPKGNKFHMKLS